MDNIFILKQNLLFENYTEYEDTLGVLETQKEDQLSLLDVMDESFQGETADTLRDSLTAFYSTGIGAQAIERVQSMVDFYKNLLPEIEKGYDYCNRMNNTLLENGHYEFMTSSFDIPDAANNHELFCNTSAKQLVVSYCERAIEIAETLRTNLNTAIRRSGIDGSDINVENAYQTVYRLNQFKHAATIYQAFCENLSSRIDQTLYSTIVDIPATYEGYDVTELNALNHAILKMLEKNENGEYVFERYLRGEWWTDSEEETPFEVLGALYGYICENLESDMFNEEYKNMYTRYLQCLFEQGSLLNDNNDFEYYIEFNSDKAEVIYQTALHFSDSPLVNFLYSLEGVCFDLTDEFCPYGAILEAGYPYVKVDYKYTENGMFVEVDTFIPISLDAKPYTQYLFDEKRAFENAKNFNLEDFGGKEKYFALIATVEERGFTLEQYQSSILDTLIYLDFFDETEKTSLFTADDAAHMIEFLYGDNKTVQDLVNELAKYEVYTTPVSSGNESEYENRNLIYQILKDAIELDPAIGKMTLTNISRIMKDENGENLFHKGTNAITFVDHATHSNYVIYRGTSTGEWVGNGLRFSCLSANDEDLTDQILEVKQYVDQVANSQHWNSGMNIITSGHSQGGNDAQVTMLYTKWGQYVDKCFSYDGQGHSPDLLKDLPRYYESLGFADGEAEYLNRQSRMYSVCGENDFVNHLGEQAFLDENRIYVDCSIAPGDIARCHDIVSMFCEEVPQADGTVEYVYGGMVNNSRYVDIGPFGEFSENLWNEISEMPYDYRTSCQRAVMGLADYGLHATIEGVFGETASREDYIILMDKGRPAIMRALHDVDDLKGMEEIVNNSIFDTAMKVPYTYTYSDLQSNFDYKMYEWFGYTNPKSVEIAAGDTLSAKISEDGANLTMEDLIKFFFVDWAKNM